MVRVCGERGALAGFEVHDVGTDFAVGADGSAVLRTPLFRCFSEKSEVDAEAAVGGFGSGDGLEEKIDGGAGVEGFKLRGDVGQDAALDGNLEALAEGVDHAQQAGGGCGVVSGGIDADDRVAGAEEQAIEDGGGDAGGVVGGVIGLKAGAETAFQADSGAEAGDDPDFAGGGDQVLDAHELGCCGGHLRGEPGGECGQAFWGGFFGEEPVAEFADGEGSDGREGICVVGVDNEAGDFVFFVGDDLLGEEVSQGQVGQGILGGYALLGGVGGQPCEGVAAAEGRGFGEEVAQVGEGVARGAESVGEGHGAACSG